MHFLEILVLCLISTYIQSLTYPIVDTNQTYCFDSQDGITCPTNSEDYFGQDGNYVSTTPRYQDNNDDTITDLVTGLMWQKYPLLANGGKITLDAALAGQSTCSTGGYNDWQLPTIKQLYSLAKFSGVDTIIPFIDTDYFSFAYGDERIERRVDSQYASNNVYVGKVYTTQSALFGFNFADGRIKGYGFADENDPDMTKTFTVMYVRGENVDSYGNNNYTDINDGTIQDHSTNLMWSKEDSGVGMNWYDALEYAKTKNGENYLGYNDWRVPNAKELQSIVDYSKAPSIDGSAAIDPIFNITSITNEAGNSDYPFFWTSTTHESYSLNGEWAIYICFGTCPGYQSNEWVDVHGAGSQRDDPKEGDPTSSEYVNGYGPQGDAVRINNFVRLVRGGVASETSGEEYFKRTEAWDSFAISFKASFFVLMTILLFI